MDIQRRQHLAGAKVNSPCKDSRNVQLLVLWLLKSRGASGKGAAWGPGPRRWTERGCLPHLAGGARSGHETPAAAGSFWNQRGTWFSTGRGSSKREPTPTQRAGEGGPAPEGPGSLGSSESWCKELPESCSAVGSIAALTPGCGLCRPGPLYGWALCLAMHLLWGVGGAQAKQ